MNSIVYTLSLLSTFVLLQIPQGVPNPADSEPLSLETPFDYILYIGMPILIFIGFLFWRRRRRKQREKEKEENKK